MMLAFGEARAEERVVLKSWLPSASVEQEITYSSSKAEYEEVRDAILERLKSEDPLRSVNSRAIVTP